MQQLASKIDIVNFLMSNLAVYPFLKGLPLIQNLFYINASHIDHTSGYVWLAPWRACKEEQCNRIYTCILNYNEELRYSMTVEEIV